MHPIQSLYEIVDAFHHVRAERERDHLEGSRRRKQAQRLRQLEESFERTLAHWVADPRERQRWRDYLSHGGGHPGTPIPPEPPLFKGRANDGGFAEVRRHAQELQILVDGTPVGRAGSSWSHRTLTMGDTVYRETTDLPDEALRALQEYTRSPRGEPPWEWARALYEDGLVDENFGLTERGRRVVGAS